MGVWRYGAQCNRGAQGSVSRVGETQEWLGQLEDGVGAVAEGRRARGTKNRHKVKTRTNKAPHRTRSTFRCHIVFSNRFRQDHRLRLPSRACPPFDNHITGGLSGLTGTHLKLELCCGFLVIRRFPCVFRTSIRRYR